MIPFVVNTSLELGLDWDVLVLVIYFEIINLVDELVFNFLTFDLQWEEGSIKVRVVKVEVLRRFTERQVCEGVEAWIWIWTLNSILLTKNLQLKSISKYFWNEGEFDPSPS